MIKGIGVDICDLRRLNHLDQLAKKILHVDEFSLYLSKDNDKKILVEAGVSQTPQ